MFRVLEEKLVNGFMRTMSAQPLMDINLTFAKEKLASLLDL